MKRTIALLTGTLSLAGALATGLAAPAVAAPVPGPASASSVSFADETIVDVTSANYQQVMEMSNTKPVVLDFTATWCHWCQVQKPYLQKYHDADNGSWVWARVDVDQNKNLTSKYGVRGIPALVSVRKSAEYGSRFVGFDPSSPEALRAWLTNVVRTY
ncbi:thioredoxin family protein [Actinomadura syzygii]|uniref:Thioredoxin family protein n=1 Tax=Actinomadura syzygii TaxID=1427538 RepID=A0A5D0ULB0_9ACTN|nr:thioredoxin family protein [Actinomadura syzygii]TYC18620.1 thioredoxin family protein [Actinomadura syzygii]